MIRAWGITDKGSVRQQNQDAYYLDVLSDDLAVGLVCDGMGGARAGNIASMLAVEQFVDTLQQLPEGTPEDPEALLAQCYAACLDLAQAHRFPETVFPPLATGKACFPKEKAARIYYKSFPAPVTN